MNPHSIAERSIVLKMIMNTRDVKNETVEGPADFIQDLTGNLLYFGLPGLLPGVSHQ